MILVSAIYKRTVLVQIFTIWSSHNNIHLQVLHVNILNTTVGNIRVFIVFKQNNRYRICRASVLDRFVNTVIKKVLKVKINFKTIIGFVLV